MKKILPLLLLATLAMLALPHIALAGEHSQDTDQLHNPETSDDHNDDHGGHGENDHNEAGDLGHEEKEVNASFHIRLEGSQQVPPVDTAAFGFAKIQLVDNTTLRFRIVVCDIANVIHSHIHVGAAGTNGPIIIHFFDNTTNPFSSTNGCATLANGIRTPSDLMPGGGINTWNDFVHALLTNNTYVNVHTTAHPGGEIRGQITSHAENEAREHEHEEEDVNASFHVRLEGGQQVPLVDTAAFGFAKIQLIDNTTLRFMVVVCDIANVTHSHIHVGAAGTNGPIIIHFFDNTTSPFSSIHGCRILAKGTRTPSDLMPGGGINTWNDFVHALLTNNTYVNVHTTAHPGGEIRGQLVPHGENENDQMEHGDVETDDQDLPNTLNPPIFFLPID